MKSLRNKALDYLSRREHSQQELRLKLASHEEVSELEPLLAQLVQENLQSDARFTESYVRSRVSSGYGPLRIEQELSQRGIDKSLIEQNLSDDQGYWQQGLQAAWQKKYHARQPSDKKEYARQLRFLLQRGFPNRMVLELLEPQYR